MSGNSSYNCNPTEESLVVDMKKLTDKAKDAFDKNRAKVEDMAEKGIKTFEDKTGKKVPDSVKETVDKIDPSDDADDETETAAPVTPPPATPATTTAPTTPAPGATTPRNA